MKKIRKQLQLLILASIAKSKINGIDPVLPQLLDRYIEVCNQKGNKLSGTRRLREKDVNSLIQRRNKLEMRMSESVNINGFNLHVNDSDDVKRAYLFQIMDVCNLNFEKELERYNAYKKVPHR